LLHYIQFGGIDEDDEDDDEEEDDDLKRRRQNCSSDNEQSASSSSAAQVIPIIGPIPNSPPLLITSEMTLSPPTPMQWRALQEAVVVHRNALAREQGDQGDNWRTSTTAEGTATPEDAGGTSTIDAAPLVAVIDEISGPAVIGSSTPGHRYATLAAVVGITSNNNLGDSDRKRTDDEESFYESMMAPGISGDVIRPFSSTVRLIGVGRVMLRKYFYRTPTDLIDGSGGYDAVASDADANASLNDRDDEDWDDDHDQVNIAPPIVMAMFSIIVDQPIDSSANAKLIGNKGARSVYRSPIHALNELNSICHKVNWMHDDRRRLVNGIAAAKARLQLRKVHGNDGFVYDDLDGLGFASSLSSSSAAQPTSAEESNDNEEGGIDDFLSRFHGSSAPNDPFQQFVRAEDQQRAVDLLERLDNLGLSYYGYFSSIPALTAHAIKLFVPYYSEEHRSTEEHGFEVASFVALRTVEGYASPTDISFALQSRSTTERLERVYDIMQDHRIQLEKMAEKISQELLDCGEECTDLW